MQVQHRLIIRHPRDTAILAECVDGKLSLPAFTADDQHTAEVDYINAAILERFGLTTTVLRSVSHSDPHTSPVVRVHELLAHGRAQVYADQLQWVPRDAYFSAAPERAALLVWRASDHHETAEDWTDPHWFDAACVWIEQALTDAGLGPIQAIVQLRVWSSSCVLRVHAASGEFYLKALPNKGSREFGVTAYLAQHFPDTVARIVAREPGRRWLLLAACAGQPLKGATDPAAWERAAACYSRLQVDCVDHVPALHALGCPVHDLETLDRHIETLCNDAVAVGAGEPDGLSAAEIEHLHSLVPTLHRHCEQLAGAGIDLTLEHGDLWPGNIFIDATRCAIIDWEDTMIAHPFFSLAPLRVGLQHNAAFAPALLTRLESAYLSPYFVRGPRERLYTALRIAAPLGFINMAIHYRQQRPSVVALHPWMRTVVPEALRLALASFVPRS